MINIHHIWCTQFAQVIEATCSECETLRLTYPAQGDLYYPVTFERAMEVYPDRAQHHEDHAKEKRTASR